MAKRLFTDEERRERRKACKRASDTRCNERKNANARRRRAKLIAAGLNSQGKPRQIASVAQNTMRLQNRAMASKATLRRLVTDICAKSVAEYATRIESVEEYMAHGGLVEVLPGFRYVPPVAMPMRACR